MGQLEQIWIKRFHRGPMDPVQRAELRAGAGLVGNADQGGWRQATLVAAAQWDEVNEALGIDVDPITRRANLFVTGVALPHSRDQIVRVGPCRLRIRGETRPCAQMDAAEPGLRAALDPGWRGGVFAQVLDDGWIAVGDPVEWGKREPM